MRCSHYTGALSGVNRSVRGGIPGDGSAGPAERRGRPRADRPRPASGTRLRLLGDLFEPCSHRLGEGVRARQRADHDHEVVDQPLLVDVQEVAAGQLAPAHPGGEDQRVVGGAGGAELADVAEVLEDLGDRAGSRR